MPLSAKKNPSAKANSRGTLGNFVTKIVLSLSFNWTWFQVSGVSSDSRCQVSGFRKDGASRPET